VISSLDDTVVKARCRIQTREPWYAVFSARFDWIKSEQVDTMGVRFRRGGRVECLYNPKFCQKLSINQIIAVIKHEIEHIVRLHLKRGWGSDENHRLRNIAQDWVINGPKQEKRIEDLPDEGAFLPIPSKTPKEDLKMWEGVNLSQLNEDMTSEELFDWLKENTKTEKIYISGGSGDSGSNGSNGKGQSEAEVGEVTVIKQNNNILDIQLHDDHSVWKESDATPDEMRQTARRICREATRQAGKSPGHLSSDITALNKPQYSWARILRNVMGRCVGGKRRTFSKLNRRTEMFGIKGTSRRASIPLTLLVDCSGSVSDKMLERMFTEIESMSSYFKITVVQFDYVVTDVSRYHKGDWRNFKIKGRGGTNFEGALQFIEENKIVGRLNMILTDGFDSIPTPRSYPVVWVVAGESGQDHLKSQGLWGEIIPIKHEETY